MDISEKITKILFENQDLKYREFQSKLMPGIDINCIIGVRTPILRKLAKEFSKDSEIDTFLSKIPHKYYDERNLHGFIISLCKDYEKTVKYIDSFLPCVDNWATCDLLSPIVFKKNRTALKYEINRWIKSNETYTIRFGIEMIMSHFLDDDFDENFLKQVSEIRSEEYYVNMMIAWYFATALAKQWDSTIKYIDNVSLSPWVHNKTIQKATESYRITNEQKAYLKSKKINK